MIIVLDRMKMYCIPYIMNYVLKHGLQLKKDDFNIVMLTIVCKEFRLKSFSIAKTRVISN